MHVLSDLPNEAGECFAPRATLRVRSAPHPHSPRSRANPPPHTTKRRGREPSHNRLALPGVATEYLGTARRRKDILGEWLMLWYADTTSPALQAPGALRCALGATSVRLVLLDIDGHRHRATAGLP